ncbi:hypothetical protein J0H58_17950, partial [bacterium]|nr:hypothetical protein [bacterium]
MTELLNGVTVLVAPGGFPARTPYVLVEDPGYVRLTRPLLAAVGADRFLRYVPPTVGSGDVDPAAAVVVASDDWPGVLAQLRRRFPPSRLVVLLNPGHYPWGYLEVARAAPDRLAELLDPSVSVGLKARWLRDYLIRYAFTGFDGLDPVWYPECYFTPY